MGFGANDGHVEDRMATLLQPNAKVFNLSTPTGNLASPVALSEVSLQSFATAAATYSAHVRVCECSESSHLFQESCNLICVQDNHPAGDTSSLPVF